MSRLRDPAAEKHDLLRVLDESCEGYLYPKGFLPCDSIAAGDQEGRIVRCLTSGLAPVATKTATTSQKAHRIDIHLEPDPRLRFRRAREPAAHIAR